MDRRQVTAMRLMELIGQLAERPRKLASEWQRGLMAAAPQQRGAAARAVMLGVAPTAASVICPCCALASAVANGPGVCALAS